MENTTVCSYANYEHMPLILTPEDVAHILGTGKNAVYALLRCGALKSIRIGHRYKIPKHFLREFLDQSK